MKSQGLDQRKYRLFDMCEKHASCIMMFARLRARQAVPKSSMSVRSMCHRYVGKAYIVDLNIDTKTMN